jgi:hypothetical protein
VCSKLGSFETVAEFQSGDLTANYRLRDLGVGDTAILKLGWKLCSMGKWTVVLCLRIGSISGLLWKRQWTFLFSHNILRIFIFWETARFSRLNLTHKIGYFRSLLASCVPVIPSPTIPVRIQYKHIYRLTVYFQHYIESVGKTRYWYIKIFRSKNK